jgi:hypothetical protein
LCQEKFKNLNFFYWSVAEEGLKLLSSAILREAIGRDKKTLGVRKKDIGFLSEKDSPQSGAKVKTFQNKTALKILRYAQKQIRGQAYNKWWRK